MDFAVITADGSEERYNGDDTFEISENGILRVTQGDSRYHYGPSGWQQVVEPDFNANKKPSRVYGF